MLADHFAAVLASGRHAVLSGTQRREDSPDRTGRWGPSIVFRPYGAVGDALAALTDEAADIAGRHHWLSGGVGRAHLTVRALERHRELLPDDRVTRYVGAATRSCSGLGPVGFEFCGVGLSAGSVMARAIPVDDRANDLRRRLAEQLGADGWLEDQAFPDGRDPIWYCSLLHFAGAIDAPERLVDWADAHSDTAIGAQAFTELALCTWNFDGHGMAPKVVASVATP